MCCLFLKGFFYARHNDRTRNLFSSFHNLANHILGMNDQALMNSLLSTHAGEFALKPKVFSREDPDFFLGGYHYHQRHDIMKPIMKGETEPFTFHVHWTSGSEKRKFLPQMGLWHVKNISGTNCTCSSEPLLQCFFRDKPSKLPCRESPAYDEGRPSFW